MPMPAIVCRWAECLLRIRRLRRQWLASILAAGWCAVSRVCVSPLQRGGTEGNVPGSSSLPDGESQRGPQHAGNAALPAWRWSRRCRKTRVLWPERDCPKSSPNQAFSRPSESAHECTVCRSMHLDCGTLRWYWVRDQCAGRTDGLRDARYVHIARNAGSPVGCEPYGDGAAVVLGARESRVQGEGRQAGFVRRSLQGLCWRAGCKETCMPGSEGGIRSRAGGTSPDIYPTI